MYHTYQQTQNNFNFIRFVAAFFVIVSHTFDIPNNGIHEPLRALLGTDMSLSYLGLSSFFLISGFLITQSWMQRKSVNQYLLNRILRIVPGLAVVVVLTMVIYGPVLTKLPIERYFAQIETFTYLKNIFIFQCQGYLPGVFGAEYPGPINGSIWTLPYEMLFYFTIPMFAPTLFGKKWRSLATVLVVMAANYWMLVHSDFANMYSPKVNMYRGSLVFFGGFFTVGALFYTYHQSIPFNKVLFWAALILYVLLIQFGDGIIIKVLNPFFLGYLIFSLAFWPSPLAGFGKHTDLSYGMYIYAYPIQLAIIYHLHIQHEWLALALTLLIVMPLAVLSWNFVEKPALKLRHALTIRKPQFQAEGEVLVAEQPKVGLPMTV